MRERAGIFDVSPHGRDRDGRPGRRGAAPAPALQRRREARARAAPSTPCSAARTAACSTTSSPTGSARTASSPSRTPPTTSATSPGSSEHAARLRRRRCATASPTTRCSPSRARRRAGSWPALTDGELPARFRTRRAHRRRRARRARLRAPATPARTASSCSSRPSTPPPSGTRVLAAGARAGRASARATRCASRPASTSTATTCPRTAARSRPASAGAARRTPASSAPRPSRAARERARREARPVRDHRPGHRAPGQPGRRRRRGHLRARSRRASATASAWPTCRPSAPSRARRSRSTCAGKAAHGRGPQPSRCYTQGALTRGRGQLPADLKYHAEHDWARIDGDIGDLRHHLVRPGPARRGRLLRPARGRRDGHQGRAVRRGRVRQGGLGRDRAAVGRDRRGQRGARQTGPRRSTTTPTARAGWSRSGSSDPSEVDSLMDADAYQEASASRAMSRYTSATDADRRAMLAAIGAGSIDDLFADVPEGVRLGRPLDLPAGQARAGGLRLPARPRGPQRLAPRTRSRSSAPACTTTTSRR